MVGIPRLALLPAVAPQPEQNFLPLRRDCKLSLLQCEHEVGDKLRAWDVRFIACASLRSAPRECHTNHAPFDVLRDTPSDTRSVKPGIGIVEVREVRYLLL